MTFRTSLALIGTSSTLVAGPEGAETAIGAGVGTEEIAGAASGMDSASTDHPRIGSKVLCVAENGTTMRD
jgi:hypothetical protein